MKYPGRITGSALYHLNRKPATISYPFGPLKIEPNYRGLISFNPDTCIGCKLCVKDCPAKAIEINNVGPKEDKKFDMTLDLSHCIYCCQCVDTCPKKSIGFTQNIELAGFDRAKMKVNPR